MPIINDELTKDLNDNFSLLIQNNEVDKKLYGIPE